MKLLEVKNFSFSYKNDTQKILDGVSFEADEGELILVCGATASGKTTLLKSLKPELAPYGKKEGTVLLYGEELSSIDRRKTVSDIGYVMQRPENQTVTDRIRSELAFCGESLGLPVSVIQRQTAEAAAYFGFEHMLDEKTSVLSGGQRQLLNLASVMAVNPRLVILDEPTAQLDPIAAGDFIRTLFRITRELSVTVIIAEHRFEELLPLADKVLMLESGGTSFFGKPEEAAEKLSESEFLSPSLPCGLRIYKEFEGLKKMTKPPLTLGESRSMLSEYFNNEKKNLSHEKRKLSDKIAVKLKDIRFTYDSRKPDVISEASLSVRQGEVFSILGSNGSGKSTLLSVITGIRSPYLGKIEINGKPLKKYKKGELFRDMLAVLPQDVQSTFLTDSVGEELDFTDNTDIYDFRSFYGMHPYDLSGGQQQLLGIKKLLRQNPEIILLDEPTKGLDGSWRKKTADVILQMRDKGKTIIIVTHDTELAAVCSDRCGIFFDGKITSCGIPEEVFGDSLFYTTNAAKLSRGIFNGTVSSEALLEMCRMNGLRGDRDEQ